jgi:hypothetical protein
VESENLPVFVESEKGMLHSFSGGEIDDHEAAV